MIPGNNLLNMALGIITAQRATYIKYTGSVTLDTGIKVEQYDPPVPDIPGSIQAVEQRQYQERGLNFQRNYITWFVSYDVIGVGRDYAGDVLEWGGVRWVVQGEENWKRQDSWIELLLMQVKTVEGGA